MRSSKRRKICVVLVDRANYGRMKPVMRGIAAHRDLRLQVIAAGSMMLERFGSPVQMLKEDGFRIAGEIYMEVEGSTPASMAKSVGFGVVEFAGEFHRLKPDMVLLIGDRYEMVAAAIAAAYMNLPIAHIQGGEVSGSIDESARHAISRFAQFHFPSTRRAADYLIRMGERPDTILAIGCPGSDIARTLDRNLESEVVNSVGNGVWIDVHQPFLLAIFHPNTTEYGGERPQMQELLAALEELAMPTILMWPNIDAGADHISKAIRVFRDRVRPTVAAHVDQPQPGRLSQGVSQHRVRCGQLEQLRSGFELLRHTGCLSRQPAGGPGVRPEREAGCRKRRDHRQGGATTGVSWTLLAEYALRRRIRCGSHHPRSGFSGHLCSEAAALPGRSGECRDGGGLMRVLGVVTARGGSKGIPRKNLAPLLGRPLLAYTAEAALGSGRLTRVVLSTDDAEIARVGRECGLEVPFLRPPELARDETPTVPVLQHAVRELAAGGQQYDAVLALQPTNPLRRAEDIDGAIELLERSGADSVISLVDTGGRHPARMKYLAEDGTVEDPPFVEAFEGQRRQSLPTMYLREGSIYLTRRHVLMEQNSLKGACCMAWLVPEERACNIDTPFDLFIAEQVLLKCHGDRDLRGPAVAETGAELAFLTKPKIVVAESEGFSANALEILNGVGAVVTADFDRAGLLRSVDDADVLWVRLRNRIDAEVMDAAPRLRCILSATTGLDHIDLVAAHRRGIEVISLRGETGFLRYVHATAEHTVALILALLRRLPAAAEHAAGGGWNRDRFRGRELHGKTVGIVGLGRLGKMVAPLVASFGARVVFADPNAPPGMAMPLADLLKHADIVTLHVNLAEDSRGFFGRTELQAMRRGGWLINTSRGELIDEAALLEALESGRLAGAALDVLSGESDGDLATHPLVRYAREHDNLILTPHIGGCTSESMEKTETYLAEKFRRMAELRFTKVDSARV